jgi:glutathione S-transferase
MTTDRSVTLYHAPNTRSFGVLVLLEELGCPYDLHALNIKAGEGHAAPYLAINPMGKVPALKHGDAIVTEQAAIYIYLADLFAEAGLAPAIGDPLRGPYLRFMVFYGSCFEPAVVDRSQQRAPAPAGTSPYGDFDTMFGTVTAQLARGPYLLGERFTAADVLWGIALSWITRFKLIPALPVIAAYTERINSRPSVARAAAKDAAIAKQQAG